MAVRPEQTQLGQKSGYEDRYNPHLLLAIRRLDKRQEIGVDDAALPFVGEDIWNHYEVSWLNQKGKPMVALARIRYSCTSECIVESKSLKLYFNSLNNTAFDDVEHVRRTVENDLSDCLHTPVVVDLFDVNDADGFSCIGEFAGLCIDALDVVCTDYEVNPGLLRTADDAVEETLISHLLKSNCLVTNQPDWGSVQIAYKGAQIDHEGLLRYIVSFRNHNEFHEQCIERIFNDIWTRCAPEKLAVYGRYTRRGGIDINPYRCSHAAMMADVSLRLVRQ